MANSVTVPDDYASIQAGIDAGADTVLVRDGDYEETPQAYRSLTLKGIGERRPRVRGLLITNPISLSLHRGFSDIEFTAPVTMNTYNYHARILDIAFEHCTLDSGLVHSYYEDPEDIEYLTFANCAIRGNCQAWSYVVTMQADTLDGGASWDAVDEIHVKNCWFRGGAGNALEVLRFGGEIVAGSIDGNVIEGYFTGIRTDDLDDQVTISSNLIRRMSATGIDVRNSFHAKIISNEIESCGSGIRCYGGDIELYGNRCTLITSNGIWCDVPFSLRAEGNQISRCGGDGINDQESLYEVTILGNTIWDVARSAIELGAGAVQNIVRIQGNIAYGNLGWGLRIQMPQDSVYLGCNDWFRNGMGAVTGVAESADDFKVDPMFCNYSAGDVSLFANSALVGRAGCGQIGAKGVGCGVVATTLTRLIVTPEGDGLAVHWGFGREDPAGSWIERATEDAGPWDSLGTGVRLPGNEYVLLDNDLERGRVYHYRVAWLAGGTIVRSTPASGSLDVAGASSLVTPNPSRGPVDIEWTLPTAAETEIRVYDLAGRHVATVANGRFDPGHHRVQWDGRSSGGAAARSGWYVIRVIRGDAKTEHRLLLLR
jgi:hypothetical protein